MNPDRGLPAPDLVFFLDLPLEVTMQRAGWGEERYERADLQKRVRDAFKALIQPNWTVIDANTEVKSLTERLCSAFEARLATQDPRLQALGRL